MLRLDSYRNIVGDQAIADIYRKARGLYGMNVVHINSTFEGGGVAEILAPLVPLMNDVGINAGWRILHGNQAFFGITKKFHNALQGDAIHLTKNKVDLYTETTRAFSVYTHLDHDCVIAHDPQPLGLIDCYRKSQPWIWRCHIDLTEPHQGLWDFLRGFVIKYDTMVVSSEKYQKPDLPVEQRVIPPAINPLSRKNRDLPEEVISKYVAKANLPTDKPLVTQVSRLDPWKDPEGVLEVFKRVREKVDCRLVFCYNLASDDPEGMQMYNKVYRKARKLAENGDVVFVVGNDEVLVNAVQRVSDVIIQKSTREGFCLAVTEALWKGKPVVASNIGGIPVQIQDGGTGHLLDPKDFDGFAERIVHVLENPREAEEMGKKARESVREKFLITRLLSDYLDLIRYVMVEKWRSARR